MEKTMTTKEIAESISKPDRTIRGWIQALAAKSATIAAKSAASSPMNPTKWTLNEVCQIIEEGLGVGAANAFRDNAVYNEMDKKMAKPSQQYSAAYIREVRITAGVEAAKALIAANGDLYIGRAALQIEAPKQLPDHIAKQVYAVAIKAIEKANDKREARLAKTLFDDQ